MIVNEFRVGNLVETPRGYEHIVEIHRNHLMFAPAGENPYITYPIDMCKPILLTEELLLKFGFEHDRVATHVNGPRKQCLFKGNILVLKNDNKKYYSCPYGYVSTHCYYAHQLQNLFFCLNGKELSIKLPIINP